MKIWYMNGAGNDFMVIDARGKQYDFEKLAKELCAITGADAATMIQNALDLPDAMATLAENGVTLTAEEPLTRAEAAETLYQMTQLAKDAPGMEIIQ